MRLGRFLQLAKDHRGDLGRGVLSAPDLDARITVGGLHDLVRHQLDFLEDLIMAASHEALD